MNNISYKIAGEMYRQGRNAYQVADIIKNKQTKVAKCSCNITAERIKAIVNGEAPTVGECMLIGQVLGVGLGYFYNNAKKV